MNKVRYAGFVSVLLLMLNLQGFAFQLGMAYNGQYASARFVYSGEFGFTLLVSYHPKFRTKASNGFAITHISHSMIMDVFDKYKDVADSDDMFRSYGYLSDGMWIFGNGQIFGIPLYDAIDNIVSSQSYDVDKYGKYFVLEADDIFK